VAPQIGWGEECVDVLLLSASKDGDVEAAVSFTGEWFMRMPEGDEKFSWKYSHGSFSAGLQSLCLRYKQACGAVASALCPGLSRC